MGTLLILALNTYVWPWITKQYTPPASVIDDDDDTHTTDYYVGILNLTHPYYSSYDDSSYTSAYPDLKAYHKDKQTLFGSSADTSEITGRMEEEDSGILYLAMDIGADTQYYLDMSRILSANSRLGGLFPWDYDNDGTLEYGMKIDCTDLSPLTGGETMKEATFNMYVWPADVAGLAGTSQLNTTASGLSGAVYYDYTCSGYFSGCSQGSGFKVVKAEVTLPDSGNATYVEDGQVKNVWLSVGYAKDQTYTWYDTGSWEYSNKRWLFDIGVDDPTQEYYGNLFFYGRTASATVFSYSLHIQAANFGASAVFLPTIKLTYINSAGTIGTISRVVAFTDS